MNANTADRAIRKKETKKDYDAKAKLAIQDKHLFAYMIRE